MNNPLYTFQEFEELFPVMGLQIYTSLLEFQGFTQLF